MIRNMTKEDIISAAELAETAAEEFNIKNFNVDFCLSLWEELMNKGWGRGKVLEHNHIVVGYIFALISPSFIGRGMTASVLSWYVLPEHRSIESIKLFKHFEKEMKEECDSILVGHSVENKKLNKFFNRLGYKEFEISYTKEMRD